MLSFSHVKTAVLFVAALVLAIVILGVRTPLVEGAGVSPSVVNSEERCAECHKDEVDGFLRSKMAHSMRLPANEPQGAVRTSDTNLRMFSNQDGNWQTLESHGHSETYRVEYVIGSGAHASGYIVSLANHLFQSPVAYYQRRKAYGLAPGYEPESDPDFTRPIKPGCLFCHAGTFTAVAGTINQYASPPFSHLAISCSQCHGPEGEHLASPDSSNIVNPATLEPASRDSICEQCHLKGVARVLNPGKQFTDFVPG